MLCTRQVYKMPGVARVGIGLLPKDGYITIASVLPDGPAAAVICCGEVLLAINGVPVEPGGNINAAKAAQSRIAAATMQDTGSGRLEPVRLTLGSLALASPKGVDDLDLLVDVSDSSTHDPKRCPPIGVNEVVQSV